MVANDAAASDQTKKTIIKLGKPSGVKLVIKDIENSIKAINSGVTDKYNLFIVVETIDDAYKLVKGVDTIKELNLGGTKFEEGKESLSSAVFVTPDEKKELNDLVSDGIRVYTQQVPTDKKKDI
ncbi:PTS permease [Companilactobacillus farciminis KCTC 3681 = DSM 20184]|nr:PTS permease [Companilactobacillus farciminis KCTC 3681 = DSM 20184]